MASGVVEGFRVLPNGRSLVPYLLATLAYWLLNGLAIWILSLGFNIGLSLEQSIAVMSIIGVGIMIPAGPGFIGNFELFAQGALSLYASLSVMTHSSAAFILILHATNALWYAATGALALLSPEVSFSKIWRASTTEEPALQDD